MPVVTIPAPAQIVLAHNTSAKGAVAAMSPERAQGAVIELCIMRRVVVAVDPEPAFGCGFKSGRQWLVPGRTATLAEGTLVLAMDASYARARWNAGNFIAPTERYGAIYQVHDEQLVLQVIATRRSWKEDLICWTCANRPDIPTFSALSDWNAMFARSPGAPSTLR